MHAQARAISLQPDAPMFGGDGTDNVVSSADSEAEPPSLPPSSTSFATCNLAACNLAAALLDALPRPSPLPPGVKCNVETRTRMPAVEWSAFAEPHKPTRTDSELYHAWYAIAHQDYKEALAVLQESEAVMTTALTDVHISIHMHATLHNVARAMTTAVEERRDTALHIMCNREAPSSERLMKRMLFNYIRRTNGERPGLHT
jgi:hypothetical protein